MSSFVHILDQRRLIGAGGSTVAGDMYFYYSGTSVLAPVYLDSNLSVPSTNPIVVAAGEIIPLVFLDTGVTYRRVIEYADGTIDEQDPIGVIATEGDLGIPVGTVLDYTGGVLPTGYLFCDGSAISRTTYSDLFSAIGTTHGAGNGTTTFNVPDYRGRVSAGKDNMGGVAANRLANQITGTALGATGGVEEHTLTSSEIPAHTHPITDPGHTHGGTFVGVYGGTPGVLEDARGSPDFNTVNTTDSNTTDITVDNNTGGDNAHTNLQPTIICNKIIKAVPGSLLSLIDLIPDFIQSGAGATAETVEDALRRTIYVGQYGAAGDYNTGSGTGTNDTAAFAAAITALGSGGGRIIVDKGFKCLIDTDLNIPDNVVIEGEGNGQRGDYNNAEGNMLGWTPALYVNSSATITLNSSSGLRGLFIGRKGLAFNITSAQVTSQFVGDAITLADFSCDAILEYLTIIGFEYAIRTVASNNRANRVNAHHINLDCQNGIFLENAADTSHISYVHGWPFVTVGSSAESNNVQLLRSGTFIHVGGTINDWCDVTHCFGYGHAIGFRATDSVNSVSFTNCGADHVSGLSDGAIGFQVDGSAREIRIINPQIAAKQYGIHVDSNYSSVRIVASIVDPSIWSTTTAAVLVDDGDVDISEGFMRTGASAIKTTANAGKVVVDGTDFRAFTTVFDNYASTVQMRHRNCSFTSNTTISSNPYVPTVASGSSIVLDGESLNWTVTGTTNCGTLSPVAAYAGKTVTLKFGGSLIVITGGNMNLAGAANFSATAKDTISLYSDGTSWYEVGRSVN